MIGLFGSDHGRVKHRRLRRDAPRPHAPLIVMPAAQATSAEEPFQEEHAWSEAGGLPTMRPPRRSAARTPSADHGRAVRGGRRTVDAARPSSCGPARSSVGLRSDGLVERPSVRRRRRPRPCRWPDGRRARRGAIRAPSQGRESRPSCDRAHSPRGGRRVNWGHGTRTDIGTARIGTRRRLIGTAPRSHPDRPRVLDHGVRASSRNLKAQRRTP